MSLSDLAWPLRSDRLLLRRATPADAALLWPIRRLPEVSRWMTTLPVDQAEFTTRFAEPERLEPTLVIEHDGRVIGDLMIRIEDAWGQSEVAAQAAGTQAELGWALDPAFQGRGFAGEAVRRALVACFDELGLRRVTAGCFADNTPSWRLMERVGMRREGAFRADSLHRDGRWYDSYTYALLREEWDRPAQ